MSEQPFDKRVDEDWKAQMRRERDKLATQNRAASDQADQAAAETDPVFLNFVYSLVGQVQMDLGLVAHPMTGQAEVHPEQAKQMIDIIKSLDKKTKRSQSKDEQEFFRRVISELQMLYVQYAQGGSAPGGAGGGAPEADGAADGSAAAGS